MIDENIYTQIIELLETTEKDNLDLKNYVVSRKDNLQGPILIEKSKLQRTLGPESEMLNSESLENFKSKVDNILQNIKQNPDKQIYLICEEFNDTYYILDGNHSFEAMKINGQEKFWVVFANDSVIHNQLNS
jgi:hypothetical protein